MTVRDRDFGPRSGYIDVGEQLRRDPVKNMVDPLALKTALEGKIDTVKTSKLPHHLESHLFTVDTGDDYVNVSNVFFIGPIGLAKANEIKQISSELLKREGFDEERPIVIVTIEEGDYLSQKAAYKSTWGLFLLKERRLDLKTKDLLSESLSISREMPNFTEVKKKSVVPVVVYEGEPAHFPAS